MPYYHTPATPWTGRSDPEDGSSAIRLHQLVRDQASLAVIGFASEAGVRRNKGRVGAAQGPDALRKAFAGLPASSNKPAFVDLGTVHVEGDDLEDGQAHLGQHISQALKTHDRLVVFGGGHETAYGSYLGLSGAYPDKRIGIINLDAHLDLRNIGVAGASSGTPFSQIRALNPERFDYLCIGVADESNSQALFERASEWGVRIVKDKTLLDHPHAADQEIVEIARRCDLLYLTIDIDLLPHYQAPGVSAPAARGVPFTTVEHIVAQVLIAAKEQNCPLPLADIVEVSPPHDIGGMTARSAAILAQQILFDRP